MSDPTDDRVCRLCKVFVPEGQTFYRYSDGSGLCPECEGKETVTSEWLDWPHPAVAVFVGLLVAVGAISLLMGLTQAGDSEKAPFYLLGAMVWFALAVGLHLLRRILIAAESFSGKSGRT